MNHQKNRSRWKSNKNFLDFTGVFDSVSRTKCLSHSVLSVLENKIAWFNWEGKSNKLKSVIWGNPV